MGRPAHISHPQVVIHIDQQILGGARPQKVAVPPTAPAGEVLDYAADLFGLTADERASVALVRWGSPCPLDEPLGHVDPGESLLICRTE